MGVVYATLFGFLAGWAGQNANRDSNMLVLACVFGIGCLIGVVLLVNGCKQCMRNLEKTFDEQQCAALLEYSSEEEELDI